MAARTRQRIFTAMGTRHPTSEDIPQSDQEYGEESTGQATALFRELACLGSNPKQEQKQCRLGRGRNAGHTSIQVQPITSQARFALKPMMATRLSGISPTGCFVQLV